MTELIVELPPLGVWLMNFAVTCWLPEAGATAVSVTLNIFVGEVPANPGAANTTNIIAVRKQITLRMPFIESLLDQLDWRAGVCTASRRAKDLR
jgi:hypothetical protein